MSFVDFQNKNFSKKKQLLVFGSIYFLLTTLYSLYHYELKFLYDGTSLIFEMTNYQKFPSALQREIFHFQQFIPVLLAKFSAPIKWIMISYVLNVYFFYYLLFILIVSFFKDFSMGVVYLLVHFRGDPNNYFTMVEELLPGACLLVVFLAFLRNIEVWKGKFVPYVVGFILLVFCFHSHPLTVVALFGVLPLVVLHKCEILTKHKGLWIVLSLTILVLLIERFVFINPYDLSRISEGKSIWESAIELFNRFYIQEMIWFLTFKRIAFVVSFVGVVFLLAYERRYLKLSVFFLAVFGAVVVFNTMVNAMHFDLENYRHYPWDRWSLPIRYIAFAAFGMFVIDGFNGRFKHAITFAILGVYFVIASIDYKYFREQAELAVKQSYALIRYCKEQGISKAIVKMEELNPSYPVHYYSFLGSLVFSSYESAEHSIQVVYEQADKDYSFLLTEGRDYFMMCRSCEAQELKNLNSQYYTLPAENFVYIQLPDNFSLN